MVRFYIPLFHTKYGMQENIYTCHYSSQKERRKHLWKKQAIRTVNNRERFISKKGNRPCSLCILCYLPISYYVFLCSLKRYRRISLAYPLST